MKPWTYDNEQWTQLPMHQRHLPLFTKNFDLTSRIVRFLWAMYLRDFVFKTYVRLKTSGTSFHELYQKYPRLIIIANHASHIDATSIAAAIPKRYWKDLYVAAAKDYFFSNPFMTFFSQHCLGAIPVDRGERKGEAINLILRLLKELDRIWLIIFPEGTRSADGKVQSFKRGVSIFAERTNTPILFLYLEGNFDLWPKGARWARPGKLVIHVGPVIQPGDIQKVYAEYKKWASTINPNAFQNKEVAKDSPKAEA
jgi:1-acyl-sn-glycerol-3-phosphate acyltransferase